MGVSDSHLRSCCQEPFVWPTPPLKQLWITRAAPCLPPRRAPHASQTLIVKSSPFPIDWKELSRVD
ncbi:hypothetical protein E2C01_047258 [Portunus trituberculatus]|uniref:Uncharacterized protein n=1 Tax=Portunus trituberculatus TaxID=210409 RepID=A0A5B7G6Z6_PORTR|nr:hypothetical protein [Portunus trituberculatus]